MLFLKTGSTDSRGRTHTRKAPGLHGGDEPEKAVRCMDCRGVVTRMDEQTTVQGACRHTFTNPHGFVFEILCFRNAPGCAAAGRESTEWTWFHGYAWRVAVCGACLAHIGWLFASSGNDRFYALIVDKLILP